jgi:acyl-CoA thioester hydrolase
MGWAYYGNYLRWFEIGRAEMMRSLGRSYREVEEVDGVLLPVLDARCRYLRGARYDERVTIETGVLDLARATLRFGYRVLGENGERCALGYTEHCVVTRDAKPVRPPRALAGLLASAPRADLELVEMFGRPVV